MLVRPHTSRRALWLSLAASLALTSCAPSGPTTFQPYEPAPGTPERIAYDQGITRYLGATPPSAVLPGTVAGVTTFEFDPADGPMCMRGGVFRASVREAAASEDLLIFLQGGGACWSAFCLAVTAAPPGVPPGDLLRPERPENPYDGWDVLYVPYCDGSLFAGDNEIDEDGDGTPDRLHHGLANLSAALSAGWERFPRPRRIVLAGSSGGGFGTILAAFLVRYVYPGVPLEILNDAGIGVARDGDQAFLDTLIDEFGARAFIPADCTECTARGHITGMVRYLLDHDPDVRIAAISSWQAYGTSGAFLQSTPVAFEPALRTESDALHAAHPDRYRRFLYDGQGHTALLGNVSGIVGRDLSAVELPEDAAMLLAGISIESMYELSIDGVLLADWLRAMRDGDDGAWDDRIEPPTPVPAP